MTLVAVTATALLVAVTTSRLASLPRFAPHRLHDRPSAGEVAGRPRRRFRRSPPRIVVDPSAMSAWADDLARSLRRGSTLRAALVDTVPADPRLDRAASGLRHRLTRGATVADACDGWTDDIDTMEPERGDTLRTLAAVLAAAATLGGTAAAPLDRFAATMRQHTSDDLERAAQSAQARMSARVLTFVPLVVLALLLATDPDVRLVLVQPRGAAVLLVGSALNGVGAWWMRKIVGR